MIPGESHLWRAEAPAGYHAAAPASGVSTHPVIPNRNAPWQCGSGQAMPSQPTGSIPGTMLPVLAEPSRASLDSDTLVMPFRMADFRTSYGRAALDPRKPILVHVDYTFQPAIGHDVADLFGMQHLSGQHGSAAASGLMRVPGHLICRMTMGRSRVRPLPGRQFPVAMPEKRSPEGAGTRRAASGTGVGGSACRPCLFTDTSARIMPRCRQMPMSQAPAPRSR